MINEMGAWLRAQIQHDQELASQWHELTCEIHKHLRGPADAAVAASRMFAAVPGAVCTCGGPDRMRREAHAKNATIDHALRMAHPDAPSPWADVIRQLAAVYADRDGYREEWRPHA